MFFQGKTLQGSGSAVWVAEPRTAAAGEAPETIGTTRHYTVYRIHELFVLPLRVPPRDTFAAWRLEGSGEGRAGSGWPRRRWVAS